MMTSGCQLHSNQPLLNVLASAFANGEFVVLFYRSRVCCVRDHTVHNQEIRFSSSSVILISPDCHTSIFFQLCSPIQKIG